MAPKRCRSRDGPATAATAPKQGRFGRGSSAGASTPLQPPSADVVFEILSWLPVRSLCRSRCVCTSWRDLISEPAFLAAHRSRAEPLLVAVTDSVRGGATMSTLQIMDAEGYGVRLVDLDGHWEFRASLGGFILLTSGSDHDYRAAIRVIDLVTGGTIASLPKSANALVRPTTWFGFGRAARSSALKVIRIVFGVLSNEYRRTCEVLTLGDDDGSTWRQTRLPPTNMLRHDHSYGLAINGVAINGVLHFLSMFRDDILCFDLESEEWTRIGGPSVIRNPYEKIGLTELNGGLCITHTKGNTANLWLLSDVKKKNAWIKAYTVVDLPMHHNLDVVPLRVVHSGGKLLFYWHLNYGRPAFLQVYDPRSRERTDVVIAPRKITIGLCSSHLDRRLCGQP